ncbi:MAG: putative bifunctional diguanylate cyclase/phosphodiesterase [Acidimicrobiales bacterium]
MTDETEDAAGPSTLRARIRAEWALPMTRVVMLIVGVSAVALWALSRVHVLAAEPLWSFAVALGVGYLLCWVGHLNYLVHPSSSRLHLRTAIQISTATAVMYLTGWGPVLALCYVSVVRDMVTVAGARAWRTAIGWVVAGLVAGQMAVTFGVAPSLIHPPDEYGLAALCALGTLFIIVLVGLYAEQVERVSASLRISEDQLRVILETANEAYIEIDDDGRVTQWNAQAEATFGWSREESEGRLLEEMIVPTAQRRSHRVGLQRLAATGRSALMGRRRELEAEHRDGHRFPVELALWRTTSPTGGRVHAFAHDITERRDADIALRASQENFRMLFERHPLPMWVYEASSWRFVEVNEAAVGHYGYSKDEFLAMGIDEIRPAEEVAALSAHLDVDRQDLEHAGVWRHRKKAGELIDVEIVSHRLEFDGRDCVLVMAQDVSERRRLEEQLRHQALHDALTGLPNRALLLDRAGLLLAQARRTGIPMAALYLDLDNFKEVNDSLGHLVGDELLQGVATRLSSALREADTVGRIGGDEFVVLITNASLPAGPQQVAEHLLQTIRSTPFHLDGRDVTVSASIGIAMGESEAADELLRNADVALYKAKANGKSGYALFRPEMQSAVFERLKLAIDLRGALNSGQLELHYQPIVDLSSLGISGVEALLRWRHPSIGYVAPDRFIPVAEEHGLIGDIGRWVLQQACRDAAAWRPFHPDWSVAVNVSAVQLGTDAFVDDVVSALAAWGLDAGTLVLEMTESILMQDADGTVERLRRLKELDVRIAIDDFGTGFSSLSYLRQFPVDILKIDRSFVSTLTTSVHTSALVHALIELGRALDLEVVAEGIEQLDQLQALQEAGCPRGQGFLFAKAMDRSALDRLAPAWSRHLGELALTGENRDAARSPVLVVSSE